MIFRPVTFASICVLVALTGLVSRHISPSRRGCAADGVSTAKPGEWAAVGTLLEACSCSVPCPCNFGQGPSRSYCHTVYAYRLKSGNYGAVALDGLIFGGGEADKAPVGFLDSRATAQQKPALEKLALAVFGQGGASGGPRRFEAARITAKDDARRMEVEFGQSGGFEAKLLIGRDGKSPIVVENNTTWPVSRFIKAKTTRFTYQDSAGNRLKLDGVNANIGQFNLSSDGRSKGVNITAP